MKYKVGDRVVCKGDYDNKNIAGKVGTVKVDGSTITGVEFDEYANGHSCNGKCKCGYGWWVCEGSLKAIPNNKIIITTDGIRTSARLYEGKKVIKSAQAICSPDDEFNFDYGARLAFDRLIDKDDKPEYYSGKVVCVETDKSYWDETLVVGRVYAVEDGRFVHDNGTKTANQTYTDVPGFKEVFVKAKFVEFKGEAQ